MAKYFYQNNVRSKLYAGINDSITTIRIVPATSPFNNPPEPTGLTTGILTIADHEVSPTKIEIIHYTGRTITANYIELTGCLRGQEGTTAQSFLVNALVFQALTKAFANDVLDSTTLPLSASGGNISLQYNDDDFDVDNDGKLFIKNPFISSLPLSADGQNIVLNYNQTEFSLVNNKLTLSNPFTTAYKNKLDGIASGAEVNVNADWNSITGDSEILNKPSSFTPSSHGNEKHTETYITSLEVSAGEIDPLFIVSPAYGIDNTDISNWNSIYNWDKDYNDLSNVPGTFVPIDHDNTYHTERYITVEEISANEVDPVFSAWDKSTGITITESQISDLQTYLLSETDPIFSSAPACAISQEEIDDWNESYSWGDHSIVGYLTVESDPDFNAWLLSTPPLSGFEEDLNHRLFTDSERNKLSGIASGAEVNVNADWNSNSGDSQILNKPSTFTPSSHGNESHSETYITSTDISANEIDPIFETWLNSIPPLSGFEEDSTHRLVTDTEKNTWNNKQNALGYTPENIANKDQASGYVGFDSDKDISGINAIHFDTTPVSGAYSEGRIYYDEVWKTLSANIGRDVTLQIGQEELRRVYNNTGSTILNGKAVYTNGVYTSGDNDVATVALAKADTEATSNVLGLATQDIQTGEYGFITVRGHVNELDTSSFGNEGDVLYLSADTAGELTTTEPESPNYTVRIGRLITKAAIGRVNVRIIPYRTLGQLSDVRVSTPTVDEILRWNGVEWVNGAPVTTSATVGIFFYNATPIIVNSGSENSVPILTLSKTPVTTAEQTNTITCSNNTVAGAAWKYATALSRTSIDSGEWAFETFAAVNSVAGGRVTTITRNLYQIKPYVATTVTITGTGTSRTATSSGGTPFATAKIDASATNTNASFLETPKGLYQITARTSDTVVTISVPVGYVNESGVGFGTWKKLFGATSPTITSTGTNYALYSYNSVQTTFSIDLTDQFGAITFGTSNNTTTITMTYNGSSRNTHFQTPLITLHGNLTGLQGGSGSVPTEEYYHLTSSQHTIATQAATSGLNGYMTSTYASKLDGIEAAADVTDATNVDAAGAVMNSDYDANTILAATSDNTPAALTVNAQSLVGKLANGNIAALTFGQANSLLSIINKGFYDPTSALPSTPSALDRYIWTATANGATTQYIGIYDGSQWIHTAPVDGAVYDVYLAANIYAQFTFNGSIWQLARGAHKDLGTLTNGNSYNLDCSLYSSIKFTVDASASVTLNITGTYTSGKAYICRLRCITGASPTITWDSKIKWAGGSAPTLTASGKDEFVLTNDDGGTLFGGFVAGQDCK